MIRFNCDYLEGAHPRILQKLAETNFEQTPGYGEDEYCARAKDIIRGLCRAPEAYVHFVVGGTQANRIVLSALLRPWEGVIAAHTAHIAVHESGAIEASGHKVIALPGTDGKISAAQVDEYCRVLYEDGSHDHMVTPRVVYISFPTELGTLYSLRELEELRGACDRWSLKLFLDGARLGYGLASPKCDVALPDIARLCDVFYMGGTKQGFLMGEAIVFADPAMGKGFFSLVKQTGGVLAKGRLLGLQYEEMLKDGLYFELSEHAMAMAVKLREGFAGHGIPFYVDSPTNQLFPILSDRLIDALKGSYGFEIMNRVDEAHAVTRFCTSWATREEHIEALLADLSRLARTAD